jgi:DNA primase catalytic core
MRHIDKDAIEALKRLVDLVGLVRSYGHELKRTGKSYTGLCPFHREKTPSFNVDPAKGTWRCFGACSEAGQRGGDAITFVELVEGVSFREAYERLRARYGVVPAVVAAPAAARRAKPAPEVSEAERAQLLDAVVQHYERTLPSSARGQRYLEKRGLFVPEVLVGVRAGFADGSLLEAIAPKGEERQQLLELGVLSENGREVLDSMIVVPLLDPKTGAVRSLYGRSINGRRHHYLKGELRGLLNGAVAMGCEDLVVVESVFDALSLMVLGIRNVVPIYGTNGWTKSHDELVETGAVKAVTVLLDSDEPGRKTARSLGERLAGRGLGVRIASLPEYKDPNEALVAGMTPEEMRAVLASAEEIASPAPAAPAAKPELDTTPRVPARYEVEPIEGACS